LRVKRAKDIPAFTFMYHYPGLCATGGRSLPVIPVYGALPALNYPKLKGSMKLEHEAGKEMFILILPGKNFNIIRTGEIIPVEVFVAFIAPQPQYTYDRSLLEPKNGKIIGLLCQGALQLRRLSKRPLVFGYLKVAVNQGINYEPRSKQVL